MPANRRDAADNDSSPADGTPTDEVDDLRAPAIELALQQDAGVLPVRRRTGQLRAAGGMAALLRTAGPFEPVGLRQPRPPQPEHSAQRRLT